MPRRTPGSTAAATLVSTAATTLGRVVIAAALAAGLIAVSPSAYAKDDATNPVTPGSFTGFGFDQCQAPNQKSMNAWLNYSPFLAVGIYISGDSRFCRQQTYLNKTWVRKQLAKGWRLLPITLGPQASCSVRYPRWNDDVVITAKPGTAGKYRPALRQGKAEAVKSVEAATKLGIVPGSTLWYDLEGFTSTITSCRESALQFLSGWTQKLHELGYVSGVYSSSGSGIKILDDARVNRPKKFALPDQIWIARWDLKANTSAEGIRSDGWTDARMKQYQGGHYETWGSVTINIDRNWLDLGSTNRAEKVTRCGGLNVNARTYTAIKAPRTGYTPDPNYVRIMKCVLAERAGWTGNMGGDYGAKVQAFVRAWKVERGLVDNADFGARAWAALFASGSQRIVKLGSAEESVRNLQRALNSAIGANLKNDGMFGTATAAAVSRYQKRAGLTVCGVANNETWAALRAGTR